MSLNVLLMVIIMDRAIMPVMVIILRMMMIGMMVVIIGVMVMLTGMVAVLVAVAVVGLVVVLVVGMVVGMVMFGSDGARDAGDRNDDNDDEVEIFECRRPGKEPIVKEPQQDGTVTTDSNDSSEDSDVERVKSMNPNQRYVSEDSASSDSEELMHMHDQMGDEVMNSDYTTKELLSLSESSSDGEVQGDGDNDSESDAIVNETVVNNVKRRRKTFPVFRPVSNLEDLVFEKHMLFTSVKQFKEAIIEYVVKGGWWVKFVKNDKVRVRAKC